MTSSAIVLGKLMTFNRNIAKCFYGKVARLNFSDLATNNKIAETLEVPKTETNTKNMKKKILEASLPFVNQHGWTYQTLGHGAESLGMPSAAHGLFPDGGVELILYFYNQCHDDLVKLLEEHKSLNMNSFDLIWFAIRERLMMNTPYIKQWPQALALLVSPNNLPKSMPFVFKLMDEICYQAGDRSVDFRWYSHRTAVLGIYQSTELYMLQDKSEAYENTWKFLSRRVKDAEIAKKNLDGIDPLVNKGIESANAAFMTIRNIMNLR